MFFYIVNLPIPKLRLINLKSFLYLLNFMLTNYDQFEVFKKFILLIVFVDCLIIDKENILYDFLFFNQFRKLLFVSVVFLMFLKKKCINHVHKFLSFFFLVNYFCLIHYTCLESYDDYVSFNNNY